MFGISSSRISRAIYAIGLCIEGPKVHITDGIETHCLCVAWAPSELSERKQCWKKEEVAYEESRAYCALPALKGIHWTNSFSILSGFYPSENEHFAWKDCL